MRQLKILIRNLLPKQAMHGARRLRYRYLICRGKFHSNEKEYQVIGGLIGEGDTVVDIGANVGHYTLLFSRLVGASGRVVAFEPIPTTFDLLASNVVSAGRDNATLINAAVTDNPSAVRFTVPEDNPYRACQATGGGARGYGHSIRHDNRPREVDFINQGRRRGRG